MARVGRQVGLRAPEDAAAPALEEAELEEAVRAAVVGHLDDARRGRDRLAEDEVDGPAAVKQTVPRVANGDTAAAMTVVVPAGGQDRDDPHDQDDRDHGAYDLGAVIVVASIDEATERQDRVGVVLAGYLDVAAPRELLLHVRLRGPFEARRDRLRILVDRLGDAELNVDGHDGDLPDAAAAVEEARIGEAVHLGPDAAAAGRRYQCRQISKPVDEAHDRPLGKPRTVKIPNDPTDASVARARQCGAGETAVRTSPPVIRSRAELRAAAANPAYTPSRADVPDLVALVAEDEDAVELERALARQPVASARAAKEALRDAVAPARARLVRLLGRLAADVPDLVPVLVALAGDADPKASRVALVALGKIGGPLAEGVLLEAARVPRSPAHRRAAVEALGKIGGTPARAALDELPAGDADLERVAARARLRIDRTASREEPSTIAADVAPERPLAIVLTCRDGLEGIVAGEIGAGFGAATPGRVNGTLRGSLSDLFRARTFLWMAFPVPLSDTTADGIARAVTSEPVRALLRRFTRGAMRYRLAFTAGGHRRAFVQDVAARIAARAPELRNDPTASTWEIEISRKELLLFPRRLEDPRFGYRVRDVPAASHPTLAAALVRVAGVRADDVVWDPFVGSATELVERARLGPYRALIGTDRDAGALAAARANLAAARVSADLRQCDVFAPAPPGVTLVLTNPPMGRRVARPDLTRFVDHATAALVPGGRLAWISPIPFATRDRARRVGLTPTLTQVVEMGGFSAEIQVFQKPTSPERRPSTSAARRSRA